MPTYQKCDKEVRTTANEIIDKYESHAPLRDMKVNIDFVFAFCDRDDEGNPLGHAIVKNGFRCLGVTKLISVKDRAAGRGDAEILLDGDWWNETSTEAQQRGVLDHELHHLSLKKSKGQYVHDCLGRPVMKLRKHDVEIGWFGLIAERNGADSQEQIQAKYIMDSLGQFFWPLIAPPSTSPSLSKAAKRLVDSVKKSGMTMEIKSGNRSVTIK